MGEEMEGGGLGGLIFHTRLGIFKHWRAKTHSRGKVQTREGAGTGATATAPSRAVTAESLASPPCHPPSLPSISSCRGASVLELPSVFSNHPLCTELPSCLHQGCFPEPRWPVGIGVK